MPTKYELERKAGELYSSLYWHFRGTFPISNVLETKNQFLMYQQQIADKEYEDEINAQGNIVMRIEEDILEHLHATDEQRLQHKKWCDLERYTFDFDLCRKELGWIQYDTSQDAHYFGVWVHPGEREIFTYAEGDFCLVRCPTEESYHAELQSMAEFYGDPPPCMKIYRPSGEVIHVFDERPT